MLLEAWLSLDAVGGVVFSLADAVGGVVFSLADAVGGVVLSLAVLLEAWSCR